MIENNCIIIFNEEKKDAVEYLDEIIEFLKEKNINSVVYRTTHASSIEEFRKKLDDKIKNIDFVISLGGDGTLLFVSRLFSFYAIPILGVNLGNLGFITEIKKEELKEQVIDFLNNEYDFDLGMMLEATVKRDGKVIASFSALNDFVIGKNSYAKLSEIEVTIKDNYICTYKADGLIIATPTGSTAYSLSAGGPIVHPTIHAILLNPICSHSLRVRPLIISDQEIIKVKLISRYFEEKLSADGQEWFDLKYNDEIIVKKSEYQAHLVKSSKRDFYGVLKNKLHWID